MLEVRWRWRNTTGKVLHSGFGVQMVPCSQAERGLRRMPIRSFHKVAFNVNLNDMNFVFKERTECKEVDSCSNPSTAGCAEAMGFWGWRAQRLEQRVWCEHAQGVFLVEPRGKQFIHDIASVLRVPSVFRRWAR